MSESRTKSLMPANLSCLGQEIEHFISINSTETALILAIKKLKHIKCHFTCNSHTIKTEEILHFTKKEIL